jgi:hypothetical protein
MTYFWWAAQVSNPARWDVYPESMPLASVCWASTNQRDDRSLGETDLRWPADGKSEVMESAEPLRIRYTVSVGHSSRSQFGGSDLNRRIRRFTCRVQLLI